MHGKADTNPVDLGAVANGSGGFLMDGEYYDHRAGWSVDGVGDVNGDGLEDVVVGAQHAYSTNQYYSGLSYVVFGRSSTTPVALGNVGGTVAGFVIDGAAAEDRSGWSVAKAGDVNGDGRPDIVVGAPFAASDGFGTGAAYVVFGKTTTTTVQLESLGAGGFVIEGAPGVEYAGVSVSGAGDVNGDMLADVVVGARRGGPNGADSGRAYVVFGKSSTVTVELSMVQGGVGGFVINGEAAADQAGFSVGGGEDIDGDGLADVVVGARYADGFATDVGRGYVALGKADGAAVELGDVVAPWMVEGSGAFAALGTSAAIAGDVDGDGRPDLILGSDLAAPNGSNSGQAYVVFTTR